MSYYHCRNGHHTDCNGYVGPLDAYVCQCEGDHRVRRVECPCGFWRQYEGCRPPSLAVIRAIHAESHPRCSLTVTAQESA